MREFLLHGRGPETPPLVDSSARLADQDPGGFGKQLKLVVRGQDIGAETCVMRHGKDVFFFQ